MHPLEEVNDQFALIRSLDSGSADHTQSQQTSVLTRGKTVMEWVGEQAVRGGVPHALLNPGSTRYGLRDAFRIGHAFAPVYDRERGIFQRPSSPENTERLGRVYSLIEGFERSGPQVHSPGADRFAAFRQLAFDLQRGGGMFLQALHLPDADRRRFGGTPVGDRVLLAERMVQAGAGAVTVYDEPEPVAYDTHDGMQARLRRLVPPLMFAIKTLLDDMHAGMVQCTLLVTTEFNRGPNVTDGGGTGRPHWPLGNWAILAGRRIQPGAVVGRTNHRAEITQNPIRQQDTLPNTAMAACGLPIEPAAPRIREALRGVGPS